MIGLVTNNTGIFNYQLTYFLDPNPDNGVAGMTYSNYLVQNCSVMEIDLEISSSLTSQVTTCFAVV